MPSHIAVATSIPPKLARENAGKRVDGEYQRLCIASLMQCGFTVISVNSAEEITSLSPQFPGVRFVQTDRNASAWTGRKNPYIADLLLALRDVPEPVVGIVNSDLIFENSPTWCECLPSLGLNDAVFIGQRYDTHSLVGGTFRRFWPGFDYFFFGRGVVDVLAKTAMPFAMGLPFWDYWLPAAASLNGLEIRVLEKPIAVHVMHGQGYNFSSLAAYARFFSDFIIRSVEQAGHPIPEGISAIVPICRSILKGSSGRNEEEYAISRTTEIMAHYLPPLRAKQIRFEDHPWPPHAKLEFHTDAVENVDAVNTKRIFSNFAMRLHAGEAFERAKALASDDRAAEALSQYETAVKITPEDFEVLLAFGEFAFSRGDAARAETLVGRAVTLQPDSTRALNSYAVVLHAAGRRDRAIETFRELLRIEPNYKDAYPGFAFILFQARRSQEAIVLLDQALAIWPDFVEAANLRAHIKKVSGLV